MFIAYWKKRHKIMKEDEKNKYLLTSKLPVWRRK